MPRAPLVPHELTREPFTSRDARMHGLTKDNLRGTSWRRLARDVYAWHAIADQHMVQLRAALQRLPDGAAFSGSTAGWLFGLDFDPCRPIQVTVPTAAGVVRRSGISVWRSTAFDTSIARGLPVTSRVRTVVDLARTRPLVEAVSILDMALHRRLVTAAQLARWSDSNSGRRGVALLRQALALAEPATESLMETRLRLLLELAGLPRPVVQPNLRDQSGVFVARPDLCYPRHRLAIEYDGAIHKDSIASDNRRQNRLFEAGYRILRFTAADVLGNPSRTVALVRRAIARPTNALP